MPTFDVEFISTPSGFLKIGETTMAVLSLSISQGISNMDFESSSLNFFSGGAIMSSLLISLSLLATYLRGGPEFQKSLFEIEVNFVLAVEMVVIGSLTIHTYSTQPGSSCSFADSGKAVGCMCIINSLFYCLDAFFAYQNYRHA